MQAIFVGGTGRSGTTIMGQLLGHHPAIAATLPKEVRFITDPDGLLDLLDAIEADVHSDAALDAFLTSIRGKWWQRTGPDGGTRGLHRGVERDNFDAAIADFTRTVHTEPRPSARLLVHRLIDPMAQKADAGAWAETTPANAASADRLVELIPDMKLIHMERDPRDTIASVIGQAWGPQSAGEGIQWWRDRSRKARASCGRVAQRQVLRVRLEDLVRDSRDASYRGLLDFVEVADHPDIRTFFEAHVTAEAAGLGRWRNLHPNDQAELSREFG